MAKKPTITTVTSGFSSQNVLASNFENLRDGFDNTLSLDGSTPNAMGADFDMNNNDILNADVVNASALRLNGILVSSSGLAASGATLHSDNYTGDGSTVVYSMTYDPHIKDNTQVYIDGVYQNKAGYSIAGTTLTFSEAPPLNADIEIVTALSLDVTNTTTFTVTDEVPYLNGNQVLMDRPKRRKIAVIADLQPIPYETRGSDNGNGPVIDQVQVVQDILSEVKVHNPDVNHIVFGGDLVDGGPPSLAEQAIAAAAGSYIYGFEEAVRDYQTTEVAHITAFSGNHDRDYRDITDRTRAEEGDPFYNYGTWFQKKFYYEIWGNFIHIYMGDMGGGEYLDDEGSAGIIPDYVFDWYKEVVENHKGFIPIVFTHQWLYDTGMQTSSDPASGQFIRLSDRFKDHMVNYPIPLWFSGHTMGDTATQVGDMHNYNATLGTLFVNMGVHVPSYSVTDLSDLTYPILSLEDGSNIGQITRWDHLAQDYVAAGAVSVTFPYKAQLSAVPSFDGRHQVSKFDPIEGKRTTIRSMEIDTATGAMITGPYWMEDYIVDDRFNVDSPAGVEVGNLFQAPMGLEEDPSVVPDTDEGVHSYGVVAALTGRRTSSGDSVSSGELVGYASGTGKTDASLVEVFSARNDASLAVVGNIYAGKTASDTSVDGFEAQAGGTIGASKSGGIVAVFNRNTDDGQIVAIRQDGTTEGNISVSGTTVSFNGGHLARWAQTTDNTRITGLLKGTVLTNLDQMAVWADEDNEQLNCLAVSSVEGDPNVAGVFVNWDDDDEVYTADMNIAMTGDMIIRIAQGTTVQRGDLLMSAGDGTAKPQGDDIVRSNTIAKVTSNHISKTYGDGSYCVPCVLMAC